MKILLLNPHVDASRDIVRSLQEKGVAVLACTNSREAWQMLQLHGKSVDMAIVHREGLKDDDEAGYEFVSLFKKAAAYKDLSYILSTERLTDEDCAVHQLSENGANAYIHYPFSDIELFELIEGVTGDSLGSKVPPPPGDYTHVTNFSKHTKESGSQSISGIAKSTGLSGEIESGSGGFSRRMAEQDPAKKEEAGDKTQPSMNISHLTNVQEQHPPIGAGGKPERSLSFSDLHLEDARELHTRPEIKSPSSNITLEQPSQVSISRASMPSIGGGADPVKRSGIPSFTVSLNTERPKEDDKESTSDFHPKSSPNLSDLRPDPDEEPSNVNLEAPAPVDPSEDAEPAMSATPAQEAPADEEVEEEAKDRFGYLFGKKKKKASEKKEKPSPFTLPTGDAVVPGGAAQSPDSGTLKKYLQLREQDVAALSSQIVAMKDQIKELEKRLGDEQGKVVELEHSLKENQDRIGKFDDEKAVEMESFKKEISELQFQLKTKADKARLLEIRSKESKSEMDSLRERVRNDIRKIRVREKELENRLELLKRDSEALLTSREEKIIELKRKLDLAEFNLDLMQEKFDGEQDRNSQLAERVDRAMKAMRVAGGLLDKEPENSGDDSDQEAS